MSSIFRWLLPALLALAACARPAPAPERQPVFDGASRGTSSSAPEPSAPWPDLPAMPPATFTETPLHPNWWLLLVSVGTLAIGGFAGYRVGRWRA